MTWESQCLAAVPVHALCLLLPMEILLALSWIGCHVSEIFLEPWWGQGHNINKAEKEWRAKRGLYSPSPKSIVVLVNYISRYESGNSTRLLEREFHTNTNNTRITPTRIPLLTGSWQLLSTKIYCSCVNQKFLIRCFVSLIKKKAQIKTKGQGRQLILKHFWLKNIVKNNFSWWLCFFTYPIK